jgi:gamma-glutamyltranspeptidase/glutathione hydrolase
MERRLVLAVRWLRSRSWSALLCGVLAVVALAARAEVAPDGRAAIASAHPLATAAGHEILQRGGNAFDAAVAVAAALGVVEPYSSGLGGGGLWLLHRARDQFQVMVDGRETAPGGARPERFLDAEGKPVRGALTQGGNSVAVPGTPAALARVARRYGRLTLGENLAPAIRLARDGFEVDPRYARIARMRETTLQADPGAARIFLHNGRAPDPGYVLRQPELAATLELLAARGAEGFYGGRVARALIEAVNRAGGLWQPSDLAAYRVIERRPVRFRYRGATIVAASLPSAGGIALAQALNMLEHFETFDPQTPAGAHLVIEVLRRAFRDRALYLGDSDFVTVPVPRLVSKAYAAERAAGISAAAATRSEALGDGEVAAGRGSTTHFSVIDADGNRVAATLTINWLFGSGIVAGGTGVLLNNEMDDFSLGPGVPDTYLLRGGAANAIAPGKRPLSSMTPTFIEDGKGVLIVGAPGGSRIVSQVVLTVLEYLRTPRVDLERLVGLPRFHHQWWPDRVEIEPEGFPAGWRAALEAKGHRVETAGRKWGNLQAVFWSRATGLAVAASDPRGAE